MKNWKRASGLVLLSSGCPAAVPVSCNSIFAKSKTTDDGYEYVTSTGSMIPKRVKKGDAASSTSPGDGMTAEEFDRMRQRLVVPQPLK